MSSSKKPLRQPTIIKYNDTMKRFSRSFLVAALTVFSICACKEPEPEPVPTPRADVNLSLGETAKVTAASILGGDMAAKLTREADDTYSLVFTSDGVELVADPLPADYDGSKMFDRFVGTPLTTSFTLAKKPAASGDEDVIDLSALLPSKLNGGTMSTGITLNFGGFPNSLTELEGVHLTEDSSFDIKVSVASPFFTAGKLIPQFTVDLSSLFGIQGADEKGILTFEVELTPENRYSIVKTFHLETFTVKSGSYNAMSKSVKSDLYASGKVVATHEGLKTTRSKFASAPSTLKLNVAVTLKKVCIDSFTGKFDRGVKDVSTTVDMSTLTAQIGNTTNSLESFGLDPSAMKLSLDVESLFPAETNARLDVSSRKSRSTVGSVGGMPLVLPAMAGDEATRVRYDLSKLDDLSPLFTKVPTEMIFTAGIPVKETVCTFRIGKPAKATLVPSVSVPMCFGAGLTYTAEERIALPQNAAEVLKDGALTLSGKITNTFPFALTASLKLVDADGYAVTDETTESFPAEKESEFQVSCKPKAGTSLEKAKTVVVNYKVTGVDGSRPLKASDYIQASFNAKVSYAN